MKKSTITLKNKSYNEILEIVAWLGKNVEPSLTENRPSHVSSIPGILYWYSKDKTSWAIKAKLNNYATISGLDLETTTMFLLRFK